MHSYVQFALINRKTALKYFTRITLVAALVLVTHFATADTLQLVGVNGATTPNGAEYVGPYQVSVDGNIQNLFCLDLDRAMNFGESWTATSSVVSTSSSVNVQVAALVLNFVENGYLDAVTGQLDIWSLTDPTDAVADGFTPNAFLNGLIETATQDSESPNEFAGINSVYNQFTLYTAQPDKSGNGLAQDFIGRSVPAPTPEPSTLALFGTGILGFAGLMRRKLSL